MKVAPEFGVCSAIWTFHYEEHIPHDGCDKYSCFRDGFTGGRLPGSGAGSYEYFPNKSWSHCAPRGSCKGGGVYFIVAHASEVVQRTLLGPAATMALTWEIV